MIRKTKLKIDQSTVLFASFSRFLGIVSFYGIMTVVFLSAIPYGTVDHWSTSFLTFFLYFFSVCRILDTVVNNKFSFGNVSLFAPLYGVVLVALVQLIPFKEIFNTSNTSSLNQITSLDPFETKKFILFLFGLLLTGQTLFEYTNSKKRMLCLVYLVLTIGVGSAVFGFIRSGTSLDALMTSYLNEKIQYAQFVNRNHFAFLMEMTLGLLIGFLVSISSRPIKFVSALVSALILVAFISANSRGGVLSMVGLVIFSIFAHFFSNNHSRLWNRKRNTDRTTYTQKAKGILILVAFCILIFVAGAFIVAFVGGDRTVSRIETIQSEIKGEDGKEINRLLIWSATLELIKTNPVTGVGFGAYPAGITRFDESSGRFSLQQAHNDYLELLATGGILSMVLFIIFLILLFRQLYTQLQSTSSFRRACSLGAASGIFGVMLHSAVDFGLHVGVNALLVIVLVVIGTVQLPAVTQMSNREIEKL